MKALELATALESDTADELLCQAYCDHMIDAAAELRRLAGVEAERDALKAKFEHTLAECRDAYPVPEVGSELEGLWGQAMGDPASVGAYVKACATSQQKEINELRAELEGRYQSIIEMGNMLTEIVNLIRGEPEEGTSHSTHDAVARVRALDEFATAAVTAVAKLKAENERLLAANRDCIAHYEDARAELERIKALPPIAWMYDRAGSAFNPQFLPAGPNADQQRDGIVSEGVVILNPDSACKNWQPLIALGSKA